jgi:hypothetical protein
MNKYIIMALVAVSFIVTGCNTVSKYDVKAKAAQTEILFEGGF